MLIWFYERTFQKCVTFKVCHSCQSCKSFKLLVFTASAELTRLQCELDISRVLCSLCLAVWVKDCVTVCQQVSTHGYSQNQILVWKYPSLVQIAKLTGHTFRVLYLVCVFFLLVATLRVIFIISDSTEWLSTHLHSLVSVARDNLMGMFWTDRDEIFRVSLYCVNKKMIVMTLWWNSVLSPWCHKIFSSFLHCYHNYSISAHNYCGFPVLSCTKQPSTAAVSNCI